MAQEDKNALRAELDQIPPTDRPEYLADRKAKQVLSEYEHKLGVMSIPQFVTSQSTMQPVMGIAYFPTLGLTVGCDIISGTVSYRFRVVAVLMSPKDTFSRAIGRRMVDEILKCTECNKYGLPKHSVADGTPITGPGYDYYAGTLPVDVKGAHRILRFLDRLYKVAADNAKEDATALDSKVINMCNQAEGAIIKGIYAQASKRETYGQVQALLNFDNSSRILRPIHDFK